MRKIRIYLQYFWISLLFLVAATLCWFYVPSTIGNFQASLLGATLGVGLSIFAAEGFKKIVEHKRRKKTLGLIKLITIPYLKNRTDNILTTMKTYNDIDSLEKAVELLAMSSHFDVIAQSFDKEWLQLIYSQDFLDAINSDEHFNSIAIAVKELLLMIDQLAGQSVNAKVNLMNNFSKLNHEQQQEFIKRAREIRDQVTENAQKLKEYIIELDKEISSFLKQNGVKYEEYQR